MSDGNSLKILTNAPFYLYLFIYFFCLLYIFNRRSNIITIKSGVIVGKRIGRIYPLSRAAGISSAEDRYRMSTCTAVVQQLFGQLFRTIERPVIIWGTDKRNPIRMTYKLGGAGRKIQTTTAETGNRRFGFAGCHILVVRSNCVNCKCSATGTLWWKQLCKKLLCGHTITNVAVIVVVVEICLDQRNPKK